jgi:hypothetical protein
LTVSVVPKPANVGSNVTVVVKPTSAGVYKWLYFYTESNVYKDFLQLSCGSYSKCLNPVNASYRIPSTWPGGRYYINAFDYTSPAGWKKYYFNVTK